MYKFIPLCISVFTFQAAVAEPFTVVDNILYYDTVNASEETEITYGHEELLLEILKANSDINTLHLNSGGGVVGAATEMANLIIDAEIDTFVEGSCESACVTMFLAGKSRRLALGSRLGFHAGSWDAANIEDYYNSLKDYEGWQTPFDFASWLYEDTQAEIFKEFEYLLERGVKAQFAIQTLKAGADGMWYPRRKQLLEAGIVTE